MCRRCFSMAIHSSHILVWRMLLTPSQCGLGILTVQMADLTCTLTVPTPHHWEYLADHLLLFNVLIVSLCISDIATRPI